MEHDELEAFADDDLLAEALLAPGGPALPASTPSGRAEAGGREVQQLRNALERTARHAHEESASHFDRFEECPHPVCAGARAMLGTRVPEAPPQAASDPLAAYRATQPSARTTIEPPPVVRAAPTPDVPPPPTDPARVAEQASSAPPRPHDEPDPAAATLSEQARPPAPEPEAEPELPRPEEVAPEYVPAPPSRDADAPATDIATADAWSAEPEPGFADSAAERIDRMARRLFGGRRKQGS